jgi:tRNA-splicing ligase RtcB
MGSPSYVLIGTKESEKTFNSNPHGSGRIKSRKEMEEMSGKKLMENLKGKGILIGTKDAMRIQEEAPEAYKNIQEIVEISEKNKLSKKVVKLKPLIVLKG